LFAFYLVCLLLSVLLLHVFFRCLFINWVVVISHPNSPSIIRPSSIIILIIIHQSLSFVCFVHCLVVSSIFHLLFVCLFSLSISFGLFAVSLLPITINHHIRWVINQSPVTSSSMLSLIAVFFIPRFLLNCQSITTLPELLKP